VEQFSMAVACDLVHFVESGPCEEDHRRAVAEFEGCLHGAEGDLTVVTGADGDCGGSIEVEIVADLPLNFHPAAVRASAGFTPYSAG
ncbi:hypothetical protein, partial [Mesorhizobium sp.]|uniref:hypothetical protein n=1 Tax=Mesorhizobium sp. TaxID=1871066 RepID=UPI0025E4729F